MKNKIVWGILGFLAIIGFLFGAYKLTNSGSANVLSATAVSLLNLKADDHITWSPQKKNILIEYSDFQCPACKNFSAILKQLEPTYSKNITFVYRHFPLFQIHPDALAAAEAAEAAGNQGKFFEMSQALFDSQSEWEKLSDPTDYFVKLATDLNLEVDKFKADMKSKTTENRVNEDATAGNTLGIDATPTFFLNGKKLDFNTLDEFKKALSL